MERRLLMQDFAAEAAPWLEEVESKKNAIHKSTSCDLSDKSAVVKVHNPGYEGSRGSVVAGKSATQQGLTQCITLL